MTPGPHKTNNIIDVVQRSDSAQGDVKGQVSRSRPLRVLASIVGLLLTALRGGRAPKTRGQDASLGRARMLAGTAESFLTTLRGKRGPDVSIGQTAPADQGPELLDLMLEGPDAVVVVHRDRGIVVEASHRFADWLGVEQTGLAGRTFLDLFPETERKIARTLYEDAGAGGVHVVEVARLGGDPRPRLVEFTASQTSSGDGAFAVVIGRDVGERAATERYLRAERDRLNQFIRTMRDSLILISPSGDVEYANSAAEQMFETRNLAVVCHRWLQEFSQRDRSDLQGLASAYEGQTLELEGNDGHIYLVTRSFLFEPGKKAMIMFMAKDITEQRLIERQNHQLEIELVRESKLAEFGTLSAGIAHNLNGPLTGILGFCDLIELKHPGMPEIQQMRQQATTMKGIVANLLQKSRNEREVQPMDLIIEDIIRTELRFLEANLFFKHQVKKVVELDANAPPIHGVYIDFSQVIGNLLRNAIDAMYHSQERILTVRTQADSKHLTLTISDTGCGMSEEVQRNLFRPFFTTKPKSQDAAVGEPTGTGLGLATTRNVLARYGAEITVTSEVARGSTFTITFPLGRKISS